MSPVLYRTARSDEDREKNNKASSVLVDGKPYFPFLEATADDPDSVARIAVLLLNWKVSESQVTRIQGGNTNQLFRVSTSTCSDGVSSVLVRLFGAPGLIDRDVETSTYAALADQGLALPYYGRFANGRLEGWSNLQVLKEDNLSVPAISRAIAISTALLHSKFSIPPHLSDYHNPTEPPTLWTQLDEWLDQALHATFLTESDSRRANALEIPKLVEELDWLKEVVIDVQKSKVGFCHNDILAGNILYDDHNNSVQFIDFEYGGMNYLAYDIANHFNEFAGGTVGDATPDYSKFPSPDLQLQFCEAYLEARMGCLPNQDQIQALLRQISGFTLSNHLVWGLWGVNQAMEEGTEGDFDFLQYSKCRFERYYQDKVSWIEEEHRREDN